VLVIGAGASVGTANLQGFDQTVASLATGNSSAANLLSLGSGRITVSGVASSTFAGIISGSGGLTRSGSGQLILTGTNTYTGSTDVLGGTLQLASTSGEAAGSTQSVTVATGATLLLAQSDQVNNSATVTLSGGTIQRASGVSEVFGALDLTAASVLHFGSGTAGTMEFGGIDYAPSALLALQLFNFTQGNTFVIRNTIDLGGSVGTGFTFGGSGGFGSSFYDSGTSTFTITAIPEASTSVAAIGLAGLLLSSWVRRRARTV
jgi:autotransporter-associated beta strand protein